MTEEQQKPVIKITDHYFTDDEIIRMIKDSFLLPGNMYDIGKDDVGFYWRRETEI